MAPWVALRYAGSVPDLPNSAVRLALFGGIGQNMASHWDSGQLLIRPDGEPLRFATPTDHPNLLGLTDRTWKSAWYLR